MLQEPTCANDDQGGHVDLGSDNNCTTAQDTPMILHTLSKKVVAATINIIPVVIIGIMFMVAAIGIALLFLGIFQPCDV